MEKTHTDVRVQKVNFCKLLSARIYKRLLHKGKTNSCTNDQVLDPGMVTI